MMILSTEYRFGLNFSDFSHTSYQANNQKWEPS